MTALTRHQKMVAAAVWLASNGAFIGWGEVTHGKAVKREWKKDMTREPMMIERNLSGARNALIIPAGRLVVIDVDGHGWYERLKAQGLPATFTIVTPTVRSNATSKALKPEDDQNLTYNGRQVYGLAPEGYDVETIPSEWAGGETRRSRIGDQNMVLGPFAMRADGQYLPEEGTPRLLAEFPVAIFDWLNANPVEGGGGTEKPPKDDEWKWRDGNYGSRHNHLLKQIRWWRGRGVTGPALRQLARDYIEAHAIPTDSREGDNDPALDDDEIEAMCAGAEKKFASDPPEPTINLNLGGSAPGAGGEPLPDPKESLSEEDAKAWAGDANHGARFADHVAGRAVYDTTVKAWFVWAGHRWKRDTTQRVKRMYLDYLTARYRQALKIGDAPTRDRVVKSIHDASRSDSRINSAISLASVHVSVDGSGWDRDPWLLGVPNGVIDLRTGVLRDGKPEDLITKSTSVAYDPTAIAPRFDRFLDEVFEGDTRLVNWLQLFLGYATLGLNEAEVWGMFHGGGSNGKSTLLQTLRGVLNDYATSVNADVLLAASRPNGAGPNEEAAGVRGVRLVVSSEAEHDITLSSAKAKKMASRDEMRASRKFEHDVTWEPTHTLVLALNQLPQLNDSSKGAWRRIALVEFNATFDDDPTVPESLRAEGEGILVWLVRGAVAYSMVRSLRPFPPSVDKATNEYRASEDQLAKFINECVTYVPGDKTGAGDAYKQYADWHARVARMARPTRWTPQAFGRDFAGKATEVLGHDVSRVEDRNGKGWFVDITIRVETDGFTFNAGAPGSGSWRASGAAPEHESGPVRGERGDESGPSHMDSDMGKVYNDPPSPPAPLPEDPHGPCVCGGRTTLTGGCADPERHKVWAKDTDYGKRPNGASFDAGYDAFVKSE